MVWYKVKDQTGAALTQHASCDCKSFRASDLSVNHVALYAIRGADIVCRPEIRKSPSEILEESFILHGHAYSGRAPFPDSQEPDSVKTMRSDSIPLLLRDCSEISLASGISGPTHPATPMC